MTKLTDSLSQTRILVDEKLNELLNNVEGKHQRVIDAMRYSSIGGGKALRPFLVLTVAKLCHLDQEYALRIACALEMVHTYSLIHDDLPAMDNDNMRRGKPSNHVQFDEATAILAGDALLTKAFEVLADEKTHPDSLIRCLLISKLAQLAGVQGMIGGQMIDLIGETKALSLEELYQMQSLKTGALLSFACVSPAIASSCKSTHLKALEDYANAIGILFQITDDFLDIEGDPVLVGKTLQKDVAAKKSTFISHLGEVQARKLAYDLCQKAKDSLDVFSDQAEPLKELADFILSRRK